MTAKEFEQRARVHDASLAQRDGVATPEPPSQGFHPPLRATELETTVIEWRPLLDVSLAVKSFGETRLNSAQRCGKVFVDDDPVPGAQLPNCCVTSVDLDGLSCFFLA